MPLDRRMVSFTSAATIGQLLEVLLKAIQVRGGQRTERVRVKDGDSK
jgi:hypothetical protein